jgi:hypothetical protein
MVLDYKIFESLKTEENASGLNFNFNKSKYGKLLFVLEQTPVSVISHDVSDYLYEVGKI